MEIFRKEKERMQQELHELGESDERIRGEVVHCILSGVDKIRENIKQSTVDSGNLRIKMTKDVVCLQRDKRNLENGTGEALGKLQNVEIKLLGFEAFDLQTIDKDLEAISYQNLRSEMQSSMTNRPVIH